MIVGVVRDNLPWVPLNLPAIGGHMPVDCVLDTGFEGDLALPPRIIDRTVAQFSHRSMRRLADGSPCQCDVYLMEIHWNEEPRIVEVLVLDGNPLLGTLLMKGCHITIDLAEGGEVGIEFP